MQSPLSAVPVLAKAIRPVETAMAPGTSSDEEAAANAAANQSNRMKHRVALAARCPSASGASRACT